MTTIARAVKTCEACPAQWDAWTTEGQYLYLRFRYGHGTVEAQPSPDTDTWTWPVEPLAEFWWGDGLDGSMELPEFAALAGLALAEGLVEEHKSGPMYVIELAGVELRPADLLRDYRPRPEGEGRWT